MRLGFGLILLLLAGLAQSAEWRRASWDVMGTRAHVEFLAPAETDPVPALKAELERINALLSPWVDDSELARVNRKAADQPVAISGEFYRLLEQAGRFHRLSNGAFDITFASAGHLYDYREKKAPDAEQLKAAARHIDQDKLKLLSDRRVRFAEPGMRIDLGGIAKGHAIDRCIALLRDAGIEDAWLSLGGDSHVLGRRDGRAWQVGIRHPREQGKVALRVPVSDVAVSTSGDYQRSFVRDGERVHHIIEPGTGESAGELASVTVIANRGLEADALSTSIFVLGVKKGLALANRLENVSAVLIDRSGRVHYSDDLAPGEASSSASGR
jgi:thiamine biosynthesis lipoprotein